MVRPRTRRTALFYPALECNGRPRKRARDLRRLALRPFPQPFQPPAQEGGDGRDGAADPLGDLGQGPAPAALEHDDLAHQVGKVGECFGEAASVRSARPGRWARTGRRPARRQSRRRSGRGRPRAIAQGRRPACPARSASPRSAARCSEPTPLSRPVRVSHNDELRATIDASFQPGLPPAIPTMKSLIRPRFWLATLLISTILTGCGSEPQSTTAAGRPPSGQTSASRLFGFTVQTMNNPFFIDLEQGLKSVIEAHGDRLVTLDAQFNSLKQKNDISDLLQQQPAAIFINAVNWEGVRGSLIEARRKKVPIIILDTPEGKGTAEGGRPVMRDLLGRFPDVDAAFPINDPCALGAISAIESAGKLGKVTLVTVDGSREAVAVIKAGKLHSSSAQFP